MRRCQDVALLVEATTNIFGIQPEAHHLYDVSVRFVESLDDTNDMVQFLCSLSDVNASTYSICVASAVLKRLQSTAPQSLQSEVDKATQGWLCMMEDLLCAPSAPQNVLQVCCYSIARSVAWSEGPLAESPGSALINSAIRSLTAEAASSGKDMSFANSILLLEQVAHVLNGSNANDGTKHWAEALTDSCLNCLSLHSHRDAALTPQLSRRVLIPLLRNSTIAACSQQRRVSDLLRRFGEQGSDAEIVVTTAALFEYLFSDFTLNSEKDYRFNKQMWPSIRRTVMV